MNSLIELIIQVSVSYLVSSELTPADYLVLCSRFIAFPVHDS